MSQVGACMAVARPQLPLSPRSRLYAGVAALVSLAQQQLVHTMSACE